MLCEYTFLLDSSPSNAIDKDNLHTGRRWKYSKVGKWVDIPTVDFSITISVEHGTNRCTRRERHEVTWSFSTTNTPLSKLFFCHSSRCLPLCTSCPRFWSTLPRHIIPSWDVVALPRTHLSNFKVLFAFFRSGKNLWFDFVQFS